MKICEHEIQFWLFRQGVQILTHTTQGNLSFCNVIPSNTTVNPWNTSFQKDKQFGPPGLQNHRRLGVLQHGARDQAAAPASGSGSRISFPSISLSVLYFLLRINKDTVLSFFTSHKMNSQKLPMYQQQGLKLTKGDCETSATSKIHQY